MFGAGTIAVVGLSLLDRPTKRRMMVTGGIGLVGIVGLALTLNTIINRFQDYGNDESKKTRDLLNEASRHMLRDYPLGIGWNNFALTINHPYPYGDNIDQWNRVNNNPVDKYYKKGVVESLYYLILAETGYHSLAVFLAFMGLFLWWNVRAIWTFRDHFLGSVSLGIFLGCGMNYVQSTLERVLTQPRNLVLWLLVLAVTAKIEFWRKLEVKRRLQRAHEAKRRAPGLRDPGLLAEGRTARPDFANQP